MRPCRRRTGHRGRRGQARAPGLQARLGEAVQPRRLRGRQRDRRPSGSTSNMRNAPRSTARSRPSATQQPDYGKYLSAASSTPATRPRAPTSGRAHWLKGAGMSVAAAAPDGNRWVEASGTCRRSSRRSAIQMRTYRHAGPTLRRAGAAPHVPASLASSRRRRRPRRLRPPGQAAEREGGLDDLPSADPKAQPEPGVRQRAAVLDLLRREDRHELPDGYDGQQAPYAPCGYTPSQLQGAYGTAAAPRQRQRRQRPDGRRSSTPSRRRRSSRTPTRTRPATASAPGRSSSADHRPATSSTSPRHDDDGCDPQGWYGEETLDVEAVHAMAPGANDALRRRARTATTSADRRGQQDRRQAAWPQIITNSYGDVGEDVPADRLAGLRRHVHARPPSRASASTSRRVTTGTRSPNARHAAPSTTRPSTRS